MGSQVQKNSFRRVYVITGGILAFPSRGNKLRRPKYFYRKINFLIIYTYFRSSPKSSEACSMMLEKKHFKKFKGELLLAWIKNCQSGDNSAGTPVLV
jgi:hypothetical protein